MTSDFNQSGVNNLMEVCWLGRRPRSDRRQGQYTQWNMKNITDCVNY